MFDFCGGGNCNNSFFKCVRYFNDRWVKVKEGVFIVWDVEVRLGGVKEE